MSASPWGVSPVGSSYHSRTTAPYLGTSNSQYGSWAPASPPHPGPRGGTTSLGRRQGAAVSSHLSRYYDTLFKPEARVPSEVLSKDRFAEMRTRLTTPFNLERPYTTDDDRKPTTNGLDSSPLSTHVKSDIAMETPSQSGTSSYSKMNGYGGSPAAGETRYTAASATVPAFGLQKSQTSLGFTPSPPSSQDTRGTVARPHAFNFHQLKNGPHVYPSTTPPADTHSNLTSIESRLATPEKDGSYYYKKPTPEYTSDHQLSPRYSSNSRLRQDLGLSTAGDLDHVSGNPISSLRSNLSSSISPGASSTEARYSVGSQAADTSSHKYDDLHRQQHLSWLYSPTNRPGSTAAPGSVASGTINYHGLSDSHNVDKDPLTKPDPVGYTSRYGMLNNPPRASKDIGGTLTRANTWDHDFRLDSHQKSYSSPEYFHDWRRMGELSLENSPRFEFIDTSNGYTSMEGPERVLVPLPLPASALSKRSILKKVSSYGGGAGGFYNSNVGSLDVPHFGRSGEYLPPLSASPGKPPGSPNKRVTFRV